MLDAVYTSWPTLSSLPFSQLRTYADVPLRIDQVDLTSLPELRAATASIEARARTVQAASSTALPTLIAASNGQRKQARTVIPLLAIQLAVLGVVVLGFVCAAATEGRRPEVALARLRGQRSAGAAGTAASRAGPARRRRHGCRRGCRVVGGQVRECPLAGPRRRARAALARAGRRRGRRRGRRPRCTADRRTDAAPTIWSRCCAACRPGPPRCRSGWSREPSSLPQRPAR